ncbi:hypothetical protein C1I98_13410 [Spongiactinospora gelatinilytica]|uniref:Uncharacterized protein n=1 Tax=Spongiactinospora gelatinilytica TaxID=2666298 RepID=A0A2W2GHR2_9ACTN|nr:hypothetical protein [Spongiactinospora gelatinilytica]PZG47463.1 hypothetical protein C1I98_13410 [Spongiactinospora gelatinilytica]
MASAPGIIAPEIAEKYGRALATVQKTWTRHPDWPKPRGRRGRWAEYDADAVDALVNRLFLRPAPAAEGSPDDLLTIAQIAVHTGLARGTIDADISRGRWPAPDEIEHGVKRWRRSTVDAVLSKRRGYRRSG